jgi:hypothetical protein
VGSEIIKVALTVSIKERAIKGITAAVNTSSDTFTTIGSRLAQFSRDVINERERERKEWQCCYC